MKTTFKLLASILLTASATCLYASPTLIVGTPADSLLSKPTGPSPSFGMLYNFDSLTPNTTFNPSTYASTGVTISSPDGLEVLPYSTQSASNELFDNTTNGTANITISVKGGAQEIGVGIADADGVTIYLQALNAQGMDLGPTFAVTVPDNTVNAYNGYFAVADKTTDIYALQILQPIGNANYSGLAIDDVQVAVPEPASLGLLGLGVVAFLSAKLRRGKQVNS